MFGCFSTNPFQNLSIEGKLNFTLGRDLPGEYQGQQGVLGSHRGCKLVMEPTLPSEAMAVPFPHGGGKNHTNI